MKRIAIKWLVTLKWSLICFLIFWLANRLNMADGRGQPSLLFDGYNVINALILFPVSSIWLKQIIFQIGYQPDDDDKILNDNWWRSFPASRADYATIFVPGGFYSILFQSVSAFLLNLINYSLALPLMGLLLLSKQFHWQLFERVLLTFEKRKYQRRLRTSRFIKPITLAEISQSIYEHQPIIVFIGSAKDKLSRAVVPGLVAAAARYSVIIDYLDVDLVGNEQYQTVLSKLNLYTLPTLLPVLVRVGSNGTVSPVDLNRIPAAISIWSESTIK
ncbi:hypothetical protein [Lentilactobacillus fungorum]|uniref:hypothetical protein n=1 Tax=Lentilactobacillus fungorum TaxID=2201250 RepID=UPI00194391E8|nr:hypothetical protein [Lentilactobacillus fungorum]